LALSEAEQKPEDRMMKEKTLALCKPDAVKKRLCGTITDLYTKAGLRVIVTNTIQMDEESAARLYADHKGKPYFEGTLLAMTSGMSFAILLEGEDAISRVRKLNGPTRDAPKGTIRGDFPSAGGPFNIVHGSDTPEAAKREIDIFFPGLMDN
jgi:nucleoside-diphosphate kinase